MKSLVDRLEQIEGLLSTITVLVADMKEAIGGVFDREEEMPPDSNGNEEEWEESEVEEDGEQSTSSYVIVSQPKREFKGVNTPVYYIPSVRRSKKKNAPKWTDDPESGAFDSLDKAKKVLKTLKSPLNKNSLPLAIVGITNEDEEQNHGHQKRR